MDCGRELACVKRQICVIVVKNIYRALQPFIFFLYAAVKRRRIDFAIWRMGLPPWGGMGALGGFGLFLKPGCSGAPIVRAAGLDIPVNVRFKGSSCVIVDKAQADIKTEAQRDKYQKRFVM